MNQALLPLIRPTQIVLCLSQSVKLAVTNAIFVSGVLAVSVAAPLAFAGDVRDTQKMPVNRSVVETRDIKGGDALDWL